MESISTKSKSNSTIMINYSFIIPHHNSPKLLNRCLDSIPEREDIEIIVVDDNSDADKKASSNRSDVRIIYIDAEHTKGAGRARNYGLKEAIGRWIIFADCDDFYADGFLDELDKMKESNNDVVIWDYYAFYLISQNSWKEGDANLYMKALSYDNNNKMLQKALMFRVNAPWNKMYNSDFLKRYNFMYEEIPVGNDAFFSMSAMDSAKNVGFIYKQLYYWVKTENGLTHGKKKENMVYKRTLSEADKIKIKNHAWGGIARFHGGMASLMNKYGFFYTVSHYIKKLFNGTPWFLVYYQRWIFVRNAKKVIASKSVAH